MMKTAMFTVMALALLGSVFAYPSVVVLNDRTSSDSYYFDTARDYDSQRYMIYNPYTRTSNRDDDYDDGYDDGFDDGYDEGYDDGYDDGRDRDRRDRNDSPYDGDRYDHCRPYRCQYEWFSPNYVGSNYYYGYNTYPRSYVVTNYAPHTYHPSGWYSYY